ncbi:MAG: putative Ig domain-containing protein, partial [Verrucomicrobiota bacterium]
MKLRTLALFALTALTGLSGVQLRADNMASIAIAPATGTVTLTPRWGIGGGLAGFHFMAQDLSLGGGPTQFYSIKGTAIPAGGDIAAFTIYNAASGAATNHADIGSKLQPLSYSALTSADPNLGFGSVQLYFIHHKLDGDYFSHIVPGSGTASAVTDLKPMSQPGGPATGGAKGYFGLTFAANDLSYGANIFYYLRNDTVTNTTWFGTLVPALAGASSDKFNLGIAGHNALAYTDSNVGYGGSKMYYLRLDPITGFTIMGTLDPGTGRSADIANLGSVFSTLTFLPGDVTFGSSNFYTTGSVNAQWQSVSFAALNDRAISAGSFTVAPSASSGLPIALTVVPGSIGAASITGPVAGVFTVTPTAPGLITLQATQAGQLGSFEFNMLRQSFTATGLATLVITSQPTSQSAVAGATANFSVTASGTSAVSYQWRKAGVNIPGNPSATTSALALTNVQAASAGTYDVVVTNTSGSILSNAVTLTVTAAAPTITNPSLSEAATVGTPFSYTITASGSPTSYSASPLPAGLTINTATGVISGTPTTPGTTNVLLGATNGSGTSNATLTITVAAAGVAPIITNSPLTAGGTVGTPFSFTITASGTPTSYSASPLPAGLSINTSTGAITGTPTTVGTTSVLLGATNATGTGNATLTITVAAAGVAPTITNAPLSAGGTVGTAFGFTITASGTPTSYSASPLPAGLAINTATGAITGTPTTVGTTSVLLG